MGPPVPELPLAGVALSRASTLRAEVERLEADIATQAAIDSSVREQMRQMLEKSPEHISHMVAIAKHSRTVLDEGRAALATKKLALAAAELEERQQEQELEERRQEQEASVDGPSQRGQAASKNPTPRLMTAKPPANASQRNQSLGAPRRNRGHSCRHANKKKRGDPGLKRDSQGRHQTT